MPLKIRLSRGGNKKRPHYRIVLADSRAPRDGKFIERLGTYNPLLSKDNDQRIVFNEERIKQRKIKRFLISDKLFLFFFIRYYNLYLG